MKTFFPTILAVLTNHPRELVYAGKDFTWSNKLWVHNIFRVYELIFGRRAGIRAGTSVSVCKGETIVYFHTFEDALAHVEVTIRGLFKKRLFFPFKIYVPSVSMPYGGSLKLPYHFAIAFDAPGGVGSSGGSTTSKTWSHTCTGSNLTLVAGFAKNGVAQSITNQTYNSVAMTEAKQTQVTTSGNSICYLVNPTTGTNTVSGQTASASEWANCSVSLTGTTSSPSTPGSNGATATSTSISVSVTTTQANSWVVAHAWDTNATMGSVTGTNQTSRNTVQDLDSGFSAGMSTQTTTSAGSYTSSWSITNALWIATGVEIQPFAATTVSNFRTLLGVGI